MAVRLRHSDTGGIQANEDSHQPWSCIHATLLFKTMPTCGWPVFPSTSILFLTEIPPPDSDFLLDWLLAGLSSYLQRSSPGLRQEVPIAGPQWPCMEQLHGKVGWERWKLSTTSSTAAMFGQFSSLWCLLTASGMSPARD